MNIYSFMKPAHEVIFLDENDTVEVALEKMKVHRYTSVPIVSQSGTYVGTLTEGDVLYAIFEEGRKAILLKQVKDLPRHRDYESVNISETIVTLLSRASNENFVPVVDDKNKFLGIVTRKKLLDYFFDHNFMVL